MTKAMSGAEIAVFLDEHPALRERIGSIIGVVRNADGDVLLADDAKERLVQEMRKLGGASLKKWAQGRVDEARSMPDARRMGKKKSAGIRGLAKSKS